MRRYAYHAVIAIPLVALLLAKGGVTWGAAEAVWREAPLRVEHRAATDLLVNGSLEGNYNWYYPNHYVAGGWKRWWSSAEIPEYDDVRPWRPWLFDGNHAQTYFRWANTYTAGIHQRVAVQPCRFYRFEMYGRNHSNPGANHRARVGIDLQGGEYGNSYVPSLPDDIVWSPDWTYYEAWGLHAVTAESLGDFVTAITYVSPDAGYGYYDTFWDAGKLTEVSPPCYRLPEPGSLDNDGFITNTITSTLGSYLVVEWETLAPASTQVWYSHTITSTPYTHVLRFPLVLHNYHTSAPSEPGPPCDFSSFPFHTPVDYTPRYTHTVQLGPFEGGDAVEFVALSRRLVLTECQTSASGIIQVVFPP